MYGKTPRMTLAVAFVCLRHTTKGEAERSYPSNCCDHCRLSFLFSSPLMRLSCRSTCPRRTSSSRSKFETRVCKALISSFEPVLGVIGGITLGTEIDFEGDGDVGSGNSSPPSKAIAINTTSPRMGHTVANIFLPIIPSVKHYPLHIREVVLCGS